MIQSTKTSISSAEIGVHVRSDHALSLPLILMAMIPAFACTVAYFFLLQDYGSFGDEGSFCTIGQGITKGYLPYQDYFNEKPPLQYFWTALIFTLFSSDFESNRIVASFAFFLTLSLILFQVTVRTKSLAFPVFWAAAISVIGLIMQAYNNTAESSLALILVASLILIFRPGQIGHANASFLVGLLQGLACGFRQTAIFSALFLLVAPWHRAPRKYYVAGFLLGAGIWIAPLMMLGILDDAINATLLFHLDNPERNTYFHGLQSGNYNAFAIWLFVVAACGFNAWKTGKQYWLCVWLIIAALPFFGRMDAFRLWPSTMMGLAYLFMNMEMAVNSRSLRFGMIALPLLIFSVELPVKMAFDRSIAMEVVRYTSADDTIWVGPFKPNVYCISQRKPASRFYFLLPWIMKPGVETAVLRDFSQNPPRMIVDTSNKLFSLEKLAPRLASEIELNYRLVGQDAGVRYYLRKLEHA